jgi:hypothetical protein
VNRRNERRFTGERTETFRTSLALPVQQPSSLQSGVIDARDPGRLGSSVRVPMVEIRPMRMGVRGRRVGVSVGMAQRGEVARVGMAVVAVVVPVPMFVGGRAMVVRMPVPVPEK